MTLKTDRGTFIPNASFSKPVLFLIFKRPGTTQQVFSAIREVKPPRLYVAANSPRSENHEEKKLCDSTRKIIEKVDLELINHLSGIKSVFLKLKFKTISDLMNVRSDI